MRKIQALSIARRLANLQGSKDIDEYTRLMCVDAIEASITASSSALDDPKALREWREAANATLNDWTKMKESKEHIPYRPHEGQPEG